MKTTMIGLTLLLGSTQVGAQFVTEIIDASGDGAGNALADPFDVTVDSSGNVYVPGFVSRNVFRVSRDGQVTEILDAADALADARAVAVDDADNLYVASYAHRGVVGGFAGKVYRLADPGSCSTGTGGCAFTILIQDGFGDLRVGAIQSLAVDASGNVYAAAEGPSTVFRIATPTDCDIQAAPCSITTIIDGTGDGLGNVLDAPTGVVTDSAGNVYVSGRSSDNVFKIDTPDGICDVGGVPCTITEIIDGGGDGLGNVLDAPQQVSVDNLDNVFVAGNQSHNAFKIEAPVGCGTIGAPCTITELVADGNIVFRNPVGIAADRDGNIFTIGDLGGMIFIETPGSCSTTGVPCDATAIHIPEGRSYRRIATRMDQSGIAYTVNPNSDSGHLVDAAPTIFSDGFEG